MSKRNQQFNGQQSQAVNKEAKKASKVTKSESEVVMLDNVMHDGTLFAKGERVTLSPDVFSLFVSKGQAAAVEVADSDPKSDSDPQSQGAGTQTGDANTVPDADKVPVAGDAAGANDAGGADAKTEGDKTPSNS